MAFPKAITWLVCRGKQSLRQERARLHPVELLHRIRGALAALATISAPEDTSCAGSSGLEEFLAQLPRLWQAGEVRPTHRKPPARPRDYRTRVDPFEGVWTKVLGWLEQEPDATAKALFKRLQQEHPSHPQVGIEPTPRRLTATRFWI